MNLNRKALWRAVALIGYLGTIAFLLAWIIWLAPPAAPRSVVLAIALLPMMPALRGILHGKTYTHQWASFLSLPYFAFGVDAIIHQAKNNWLGLVLVLLTTAWFFGCVYYARQHKPAKKVHVEEQTGNQLSEK